MNRLVKYCVAVLSTLLLTVAVAAAGPVTIAWDANPEPDVAGYLVSYGTAPGAYGTTIDVGPATTWTLTDGVDGRTYYFTVQAYNRDGVRSSYAAEVFETIAATGGSPTGPVDPSVPHSAPFGVVDTPIDGVTGLAGSIAVTGWALDERGIASVAVYRDRVAPEPAGPQVFIGNATLIEGARPDVAATYPASPGRTRAGWGLLVLTNMLPNGGNGTYRLHAYATDTDNMRSLLGSRTITCANATSPHPFGAIDTPEQGATISGSSYANFGWVLSRGTRRADGPGGGTVRVVIDGVAVGTPVGWTNRSDLSTLFPIGEFAGVNTALAVYSIDTTQLSNGLHTIAWSVIDNQPTQNAAGIGSRYFTVANGSALTATSRLTAAAHSAPDASSRLSIRDEIALAPRDAAPIVARRGFSLEAPFRRYGPDANGRVTIQGEELDRFELRLPAGKGLSGHVRSGDDLLPLPIGSRLDPVTGVFTWQPGVGFVGAYDFVFVRRVSGTAVSAQDVRIVLNPKASGRVGPQVVIDTPSAVAPRADNAGLAQPFVVAGWALDLDSEKGTGVDTLHVWAYPVDGSAPKFVGVADRGGRRPDVAAVHGDQFRDAGYGLIVKDLAPGMYDLAVFAWSIPAGGFAPARVVRVTVR
jgi:hypothetical protein